MRHVRIDEKTRAALKRRRKAVQPDVVLAPHKPLKMKTYRQREAYCGPSSIKIASEYFGYEFDEVEIGKKCGTTVEEGTDHEGMIDGAEKLGAMVYAMHGGDISDLRYFVHENKLPVIVAWYSPFRARLRKYRPGIDPIDGHYSVVYHVSRTHVYLMDPDLESGRRKMPIKRFLYLWWNQNSERKICMRHWFMVLRYSERGDEK